ncbi:MAG: TfoX/Sxy family protein [Pseudomonadota bacterium]
MTDQEICTVQMRDDLGLRDGLSEKRMFGGLCFLLDGNMVCIAGKTAAIYRVGKHVEPEALAFPNVVPMAATGRKMGGIVQLGYDAFVEDAETREKLTQMALAHAGSLPPK